MAVADKTRMSRQEWLTKVPAITATFWVIKILSTTIGETFADYLAVRWARHRSGPPWSRCWPSSTLPHPPAAHPAVRRGCTG